MLTSLAGDGPEESPGLKSPHETQAQQDHDQDVRVTGSAIEELIRIIWPPHPSLQNRHQFRTRT